MSRLPLSLADEVPLYQGDLETDLTTLARNRRAEQITGGLSWPSKLPCPAWGISAARCRMGSLLAANPRSVCHPDNCYAKKGRIAFGNVQKKLEQAYLGLFHPLHVPAAVFMIEWECPEDLFRF